jgi:hypothetical protein
MVRNIVKRHTILEHQDKIKPGVQVKSLIVVSSKTDIEKEPTTKGVKNKNSKKVKKNE